MRRNQGGNGGNQGENAGNKGGMRGLWVEMRGMGWECGEWNGKEIEKNEKKSL